LWTLPEVAKALHLSERTLMRRLKDEGLRYQTLHDAELHRQTVIYLNDKRHTTESLAAALGYSDTSGFRRAFHRWFGMSLGEYLRREA
jgi:AraC-like DNA-binding protein